ncbi:glycosyltransferase [Nakamurella deserti]|uniref:glycosyltransferase n=1 Tax=Nakamurella deserti TaxID=2164074 RepID=UPI0013004C7C|nr:glycosyltransferase [Nakamurella deserti]
MRFPEFPRADGLPGVGLHPLAGFETTFVPRYGVDSAELTGHLDHWAADLEAVRGAGVRHLRYALRWNDIERSPGEYDWERTDLELAALRDSGMVPVVDLLHHTSYPRWLRQGFADPDFGSAYRAFAVGVADRHPWLPAYTLVNEPFATLFLAGHEALWPPYRSGLAGFRELLLNVLPSVSQVAAHWRQRLPHAAHVWIDTAEHHRGAGRHAEYAALANDRRHVVLDLITGHDLRAGRPFLDVLLDDPAMRAMVGTLAPLQVDVLGLDYYPHSEWFYDDAGGHAPSPSPLGFAAVAGRYGDRYGLPMMLTETNIRGLPSDRVTWLKYMVEQYEQALRAGVPLRGFCWFPHVDSCDWDSLLARAGGRRDPVGVLTVDEDRRRRRTVLTEAWESVAAGAAAADLPAYRWQPPNDVELAGFAASVDWSWQDPAVHTVAPIPVDLPGPPPGIESEPMTTDLIVLSHLRWTWVWQRPQHLVSRIADRIAADRGARTWFVEEPLGADVTEPRIAVEEAGPVTRVWLEVPSDDPGRHLGFSAPEAQAYPELLAAYFAGRSTTAPDVWLYSPMAFDLAQRLAPRNLVYDVMDDLASFAEAPSGLVLRQRRALAEADIVFTGGRSLHRGVLTQRRQRVHLHPSGVETAHYARSRALRTRHDRPVAGYVGVIDERLDLDLIAGAAALLPDWEIRVVGPIAKIDAAALPQSPNLTYPGMVAYPELPAVMAGFDVALMPFALNEATRSISPTKTLEYLAAGLPVVSTRVPDVVADFADCVRLVDGPAELAAACRQALDEPVADVGGVLARHEWDAIAEAMWSTVWRERPGLGSALSASGTAATA